MTPSHAPRYRPPMPMTVTKTTSNQSKWVSKVDLQPDAGEEKRNEHRVDHLRNDLARPLGELPGLARHDPGEEEPEQRVDADPLGDRPAQHPEQNDERQAPRPAGASRAV